MAFKVPEKYRLKTGPMRSDESYGNNGQFIVNNIKIKSNILCQASDGFEWEHVSASIINRCPTWNEMCFIKDLFWDDEDCIIQYHPPKGLR